MPKIILLKGLPASGKSTWAKNIVNKHPGAYTRVNKDELRRMMHEGKWSKHNEKIVLEVRDQIIRAGLDAGQHVIVDDTNLHVKHYSHLKQLFKGVEIEVKEFDIDVEEAVKRDLKREFSVGRDVIEMQYDQFLAPLRNAKYTPPEGKPHAIIVDIDGTIAHMNGRGPYDLDKVGTDDFDETISDIAKRYVEKSNNYVIILSGREDSVKKETVEWLKNNEVRYDELFMRKAGDTRKDYVIKQEIFDKEIRDNFQVDFVLDDRNQVVKMWRRIGLKCLQVAEGNF